MPDVCDEVEINGYLLTVFESERVVEPGDFFFGSPPPFIVYLPDIFDLGDFHPFAVGHKCQRHIY